MFGAEPQEEFTYEDVAEFEAHAAQRLHHALVRAYWATAVFIGTILAVIPFLEGHSLHAYWENTGKYLLLAVMGELLWIVSRWGLVYSSWQSTREIRRDFGSGE